MSKVWTINVQVNTLHIRNLSGTGTWERPIGAGEYWRNNVRMTAVSDDPADNIVIGDGDSFALTVSKDDEIKWVVSEVNPIYKNQRSVCMYGFSQGSNWDSNLTPPNTLVTEAAFAAIQNGFNAPEQPLSQFLTTAVSDISIPQTTVRAGAQNSSVSYYMRLLLIDTSNLTNPTILKYVQVDPVINIKL